MPRSTETFSSIFPLSVWHPQEGGSGLTYKFESTHGRKTWGTHFKRTWLDQHLDPNHSREVVLLHDPRISPYQSHVGPVAGMGLGIGPWLGAINCAPKYFHAHTHAKIIAVYMTPSCPPLICAFHARYYWLRTRDSIRGPDNVCYLHSGRRKNDIGIKSR